VKILINFGNKLKEIRRERQLSQEKLAEESGLHRTYIGGVERGERNPTLTTLKKLADALNISLEELLKGIE
jgi:transcriptional regulator with XRE-family HTH domain